MSETSRSTRRRSPSRGERDQALEVGHPGERGAEPQQGSAAQRGAAHPRHLVPVHQHGRGARPEGNQQVALAGRAPLPREQRVGARRPRPRTRPPAAVSKERRRASGRAPPPVSPIRSGARPSTSRASRSMAWAGASRYSTRPSPRAMASFASVAPTSTPSRTRAPVPGRGRGLGLGGNRHWNQLVRLRSVVD